jgi:uncharacterized DUF497 family protein
MKPFRWSTEKNEALETDRGVSFETIVVAIDAGGHLDILSHPNQANCPRQQGLVVAADNYVYLAPAVEEKDGYYLKTIIPSRKATRDFLNRGEADAKD